MSTNLYLENDEYHEDYMDQLTDEGMSLQCEMKNLNVPSSEPNRSLPDVLMCADKCSSKIEMPWLKITLPPSEFYEIRNAEKYPKNVRRYQVIRINWLIIPQTVCDCFIADVASDDESEEEDEAEDSTEEVSC